MTRVTRGTWLLTILGALVTLAGCATPGLREETARQRADLVGLGQGLDGLRQEVAALRVDLSALRGQFGQLSGETRATLSASQGRQEEWRDGVEHRLAGAERRVDDLAGVLAAVETSVGGLADQVARLEAVSIPPPRTRPAPRGKLTAAELFDRAMESFRGGELGQAVLDFEEFVAKYPGHSLAANAQFWIGESYFRARDFENAVAEYQKAVDLAPTGDKSADALLRLGLALRALKREDRAREAWGRLVRDFPDSEAAQRARMVLREPPRSTKPGATTEPK